MTYVPISTSLDCPIIKTLLSHLPQAPHHTWHSKFLHLKMEQLLQQRLQQVQHFYHYPSVSEVSWVTAHLHAESARHFQNQFVLANVQPHFLKKSLYQHSPFRYLKYLHGGRPNHKNQVILAADK